LNNLNTNPIIGFETAKEFETWLKKNHDQFAGIWLKIFKKDSGIKTITYAEALDVALCYGWIDSQLKSFNDKAYIQRFGPRNPKSVWSKINTGHVERLLEAGRMQPSGLKAIEKAKADGSWANAYDSQSKMTIPEDFLKELRKNKKAEAFFMNLNKANLYAIAFRLQTAKKPETREKRMKEILEMLAKGGKFH
jgi:uncharacterized protein YdeI (YjbR/CyaY-like superfamily)